MLAGADEDDDEAGAHFHSPASLSRRAGNRSPASLLPGPSRAPLCMPPDRMVFENSPPVSPDGSADRETVGPLVGRRRWQLAASELPGEPLRPPVRAGELPAQQVATAELKRLAPCRGAKAPAPALAKFNCSQISSPKAR